jgi:hypothetical protein
VFGCRWKQTPACRSIRYTSHRLDVEAIAPLFCAHVLPLAEDAIVIALDGKTLRGSLDRFEGRRAAQVLSAFAVGERIVLGQGLIEAAGENHEIQAAQRLMETVGLAGRLYTLDARHLQKTVEAVIATGSDLLVQLKGNHPKLRAAIRAVCQTQSNAEQTYMVDLGRRNRIEQRMARVWSLPEGGRSRTLARPFKAVVEVCRRVEEFNPRRLDGRLGRDPSRSLRDRKPAPRRAGHRPRRGCEPHIRKNPGVFAHLRHFALNRLRHNGQSNIHAALYDNAMDVERVLNDKGIKH